MIFLFILSACAIGVSIVALHDKFANKYDLSNDVLGSLMVIHGFFVVLNIFIAAHGKGTVWIICCHSVMILFQLAAYLFHFIIRLTASKRLMNYYLGALEEEYETEGMMSLQQYDKERAIWQHAKDVGLLFKDTKLTMKYRSENLKKVEKNYTEHKYIKRGKES